MSEQSKTAPKSDQAEKVAKKSLSGWKIGVALLVLSALFAVLGVVGLGLADGVGDERETAAIRGREWAARRATFEATLDWVLAEEDRRAAARAVAAASVTPPEAAVLDRLESDLENATSIAKAAERSAHRAQTAYDLQRQERADQLRRQEPSDSLLGWGAGASVLEKLASPSNSREASGEPAEVYLWDAAEAIRDERASKRVWLARRSQLRAFEISTHSSDSLVRAIREKEDAASREYEGAKDALASLLPGSPADEEEAGGFGAALRRFVFRSLCVGAPAFLLLSGVLLLGLFLLPVLSIFGGVLQGLVKGLGSAFGMGASPGSIGHLAGRAGVVGSAIVATAVATAVVIPGDTIGMRLSPPEVSEVDVRIGEFGVSIPGKSVTLDTSDPTPPESRVTMQPYTIRIPGKTIDIPESSVTVVSGEGRIDRPEITLRPPDVRIVMEEPRSDDLARILGELTTRVGDLDVKVGRVDSKVEQLDGQIDSANRTLAKVESASGRLVIEAQEEINEVNGKTTSALFQQTRIRDNCNRFCGLAATSPSALAKCASPGRFEPFLPWKAPGTTGCGPLGDGQGSEDAGLSTEP